MKRIRVQLSEEEHAELLQAQALVQKRKNERASASDVFKLGIKALIIVEQDLA